MSEMVEQGMDADARGSVSSAQPSAGMQLRQAREAAGLHIAALAVSLKVPVKKLEALEADRLDLLPDAVFARALASSVCRTLKADPTPILASLPQTVSPNLHAGAMGINTPFSAPGQNTRATVWEQLSRPVVMAALALVLGALVLVLLPSFEHAPGTSAAPTLPALPSLLPAAVTDLPTGASSGPAAVSGGGLVSSAASPPVVPVPAPPGLSAPSPAPAAVQATVSGIVGTGGIVVLTAKGASWVEVTDAGGIVQLRKTLSTGETASASGGLPLMVTVGRADTTEVLVRGKPFDLAPLTKNNVARFEVR
jgi:cytoskeleton protein RodZ